MKSSLNCVPNTFCENIAFTIFFVKKAHTIVNFRNFQTVLWFTTQFGNCGNLLLFVTLSHIFWQKFRESNVLTKEITEELIWRFFLVRLDFSLFPQCSVFYELIRFSSIHFTKKQAENISSNQLIVWKILKFTLTKKCFIKSTLLVHI